MKKMSFEEKASLLRLDGVGDSVPVEASPPRALGIADANLKDRGHLHPNILCMSHLLLAALYECTYIRVGS